MHKNTAHLTFLTLEIFYHFKMQSVELPFDRMRKCGCFIVDNFFDQAFLLVCQCLPLKPDPLEFFLFFCLYLLEFTALFFQICNIQHINVQKSIVLVRIMP